MKKVIFLSVVVAAFAFVGCKSNKTVEVPVEEATEEVVAEEGEAVEGEVAEMEVAAEEAPVAE